MSSILLCKKVKQSHLCSQVLKNTEYSSSLNNEGIGRLFPQEPFSSDCSSIVAFTIATDNKMMHSTFHNQSPPKACTDATDKDADCTLERDGVSMYTYTLPQKEYIVIYKYVNMALEREREST